MLALDFKNKQKKASKHYQLNSHLWEKKYFLSQFQFLEGFS